MDEQRPHSGLIFGDGFIQFNDEPPIPVTGPVDITFAEEPAAAQIQPLKLSDLPAIRVEVPMAPEQMVSLLRGIEMTEVADRIEVETHPDLIEMDERL